MKPTQMELDEFKIIGISVRTTNQNAQSSADIGQLWTRFMSENLMREIPNKVSDDVYCIYTDYESDFNGSYTAILGCKVTSFDDTPAGFINKLIPPGKYLQYISKGKLPECIAETWRNIWQSNVTRKYTADFDVYGAGAQDPEDVVVETFVAI